ncbi:MAG: tetratricopeptide repeat protein [Defluviitaleaceae bacterium]|nr:tetratricopeptide repeat protein [Defluviitaleaceae bacterium]
MKIQLCASQSENLAPYAFKTTGIRVYSFEEVLYHVRHRWRESVDEFLSENMISWVTGLGHSYFASRMKEIRGREKLSDRIFDFLRLVDYFDASELDELRETLEKWELRREWEKLKERADFFAEKMECEQAIPLYRRALEFDENVAVLNNLAVQHMQLGAYDEGLACLARALAVEPKNFRVLLHYVEAAILAGEFEKAAKGIREAVAIDPNHADLAFLLGLMSHEKKDFSAALAYFEKAHAADKTVPFYLQKAADVHLQMRQYEKALKTLQKITVRNSAYYAKEAEIYAAWGDLSRAIKSMTLALRGEPTLYAKLAAYHRLDYDPERADVVIKRAIALSPENNAVRLENARIKKGLGKHREYQAALNEILEGFKADYRIDLS